MALVNASGGLHRRGRRVAHLFARAVKATATRRPSSGFYGAVPSDLIVRRSLLLGPQGVCSCGGGPNMSVKIPIRAA